jgi:hypothetical protein
LVKLISRNGKLLHLPSKRIGRALSGGFEYVNCDIPSPVYQYEVCALYTCEDTAQESIDLSEGGTITAVTSPTPSGGTVAITGGGKTITYTPFPGFTGQELLNYTLNGVTARTRYAVVFAAPTATADNYNVQTDVPTNLNVLSNDIINNPDRNTLTILSVTDPANGTTSIVNNQIQYTTDPLYEGADSFSYTMTDGLCTATATVNITASNTPTADCSAGTCSDNTGAIPCPQIIATITDVGGGPGTINWIGESWTFPADDGVGKPVCPQVYRKGSNYGYSFHSWRNGNIYSSPDLWMRRTLYFNGTVSNAQKNNITMHCSGALTTYQDSFHSPFFDITNLDSIILTVPDPTNANFYLTTPASVYNSFFPAGGVVRGGYRFEWTLGVDW